MIAALALFKRALPYLIAAAAIAAVLFGAYRHGVSTEGARKDIVISNLKLEAQVLRTAYATETVRLSEEARAKEQAAAEQIAAIDKLHTKEIKDHEAIANSVIDSLRADTVSLRARFTCTNTTAAGQDGQATTTASVGDGTGSGGLSKDDAQFLIRRAERADKVVAKLSACQAIVRADRE